MMVDNEIMDFLKKKAKTAKLLTSVGTGYLILGGRARFKIIKPHRTGPCTIF